jgi:hypothetical protein
MFTGFGVGKGSVDSLMQDWLFHAVLLGACAVCAMRAAFVAENRLAWALIAAGVALWTLGDVYWSLFLVGDDAAPFPSPADAGWLAFYACAYVAC